MAIAGIDRREQRRSKIVVSLLLFGMLLGSVLPLGLFVWAWTATSRPPDDPTLKEAISARLLGRPWSLSLDDLTDHISDLLEPLANEAEVTRVMAANGFACRSADAATSICSRAASRSVCKDSWVIRFRFDDSRKTLDSRATAFVACL